MSLPRLRTFIEVYRQGSITAAARALNLTQPAVSQHIAGLEVAVGRPLFVRSATGVSPTSAADELAADVGDKLDAAESALASARARSVDVAGALQIIGHADFLAEVVCERLRDLLEVGVRVRMQTGARDLIENMLVEGHCDLGISAFATVDKRLRCELIRAENVMVVAPPAVAARIMNAPSLRQGLVDEPLVAYSFELPMIDQWLERNRLAGEPLIPAVIGQDLRALRSLLRSGFGWTALPGYLCQRELDQGELVEIPAPHARGQLNYYLVWAPSALRTPRVAHARQAILWALGKKEGAD